MNKKRFTLSALITTVVLAIAITISVTMMIAIRQFNQQVNAVMQKQALYSHISDVDAKVRSYYPSLDEKQLQAAVAAGYVSGLNDPYAKYLNADEYQQATLKRKGQSSGLGITLVLNDDGELAVNTIAADQKVGIQKGDVLVAVNEQEVSGVMLRLIQERLDNTAEKVQLSVRRDGKILAFDVTPYTYSLDSVTDRMIGGNIGYIRISAFCDNTEGQFTAAYSALQSEGASSFIFDLRNCEGGGSRAALEGILSYVMPHGAYAVYTDSLGTTTNLVAHSSQEVTAPIVVLTNERTTGEAELMAGVLQEFGVGTVLGKKTAGKGKLQDFVPLKEDNAALLLTVGEISLIRGGSIEGVGITPNTEVDMSVSKIDRIGTMEDKEDDQLQAALATLAGNVSGNIAPGTTTTTVSTTATDTTATTGTTAQ